MTNEDSDSAFEGKQPSNEPCWPIITGVSNGLTLTRTKFDRSRLLLSDSADPPSLLWVDFSTAYPISTNIERSK